MTRNNARRRCDTSTTAWACCARKRLVDGPTMKSFDLAEVYHQLAAEKQLAGYEVKQRFYEIGSPEGLAELDALLRNQSAFCTS